MAEYLYYNVCQRFPVFVKRSRSFDNLYKQAKSDILNDLLEYFDEQSDDYKELYQALDEVVLLEPKVSDDWDVSEDWMSSNGKRGFSLSITPHHKIFEYWDNHQGHYDCYIETLPELSD